MINYKEISKQLETQYNYQIISKLTIFHELESVVNEENLTDEEINNLIDTIYDFYISSKLQGFNTISISSSLLEISNKYGGLRQCTKLLSERNDKFIEDLEIAFLF